jgi:hypothetical protein
LFRSPLAVGDGQTPSRDRDSAGRRFVFAAAGVITSAWLVWPLAQGHRTMSGESLISFVFLLGCFGLLLWWLPETIPLDEPGRRTRRLLFTLAAAGLTIALFAVVALISRLLLFLLPPAALGILLIIRRPVSRKQIIYVLALGTAAAVAALGAGWLKWDISLYAWSGLQFALVPTCLLAGGAILSKKGLLGCGVGWSIYLNGGAQKALAAFGIGALIGIPCALANVSLGGPNNDQWVTALTVCDS